MNTTGNYIPPKEFQAAASINVQGKKIIITPQEQIRYNKSVTVVLDSSVKSTSGTTLGEQKTIHFTTEYGPLYAEPMELRPILRGLFPTFTIEELYIALRNASQKAHQLIGRFADINDPRYIPVFNTLSIYFPTTRFVLYEAARSLLSSMLVNLLNQQNIGSSDGSGPSYADSMVLGDLSITSKANTSVGGGISVQGDSPINLVKSTLQEVTHEQKFWQDSMMGRNKRGYASVATARTRSKTPGPADRGF